MANEKNSASEELFREEANGMTRSLSGGASPPTARNSIMFDEESFDPVRVDLHNSGGEIHFASSVDLHKGESRFVEAESRGDDVEGGYWSPKHVAGYEAEYQDEKWAKDYMFRSDVWLFSEEEVEEEEEEERDPTPTPTPVEPSSHHSTEPPESSSSESEESDNCCMDCGEGPCKMRKMMEAGFPSMLPGIGWGGFGPYGFPMPMHQPGVPLHNLNESTGDEEEEEDDDDDEENGKKFNKMALWKEVGIDKSKLKGKTMVFIEKDSADSDEESGSSDSGSVTSAATTKLTSCADGLESDEDLEGADDILKWAKQKKRLADLAIEHALPLKDALVEFFEQGIVKGEEVEAVIDAYNEAYITVKDSLAEWREELKKLDINAEDEKLGLDSTDDLKMIHATGKGPSASAACDSVKILMKLNRKVQGLVQGLPMNEFKRLTDFMVHSQSEKRAKELQAADTEKSQSTVQVNANKEAGEGLDEKQSKSTVRSSASFPSDKTKDGSFRKNRKEVIEGLTKELNKGPSKASLTTIQELRRRSRSTLRLTSDKSVTSLMDVDTNLKPRSLYDVPVVSMGPRKVKQNRDFVGKMRRRRFVVRSGKLESDTSSVSELFKLYPMPPEKVDEVPRSKKLIEQQKLRRIRLGLETNPLGLSASVAPLSSLLKGTLKPASDDDCEPATEPKKLIHQFKPACETATQSQGDVPAGIRRVSTAGDAGWVSRFPLIGAPVLEKVSSDADEWKAFRKERVQSFADSCRSRVVTFR